MVQLSYGLREWGLDDFGVWIYEMEKRYCATQGKINWSWGSASGLNGNVVLQDWNDCVRLLERQALGDGPDEWMWLTSDTLAPFRACDIRGELDQMPFIPETKVLKWSSWIPKKINYFLWRVVLNRIPTKEALAIRNVPMPSLVCVMCNKELESADHLLITCEFAQQLWVGVSQWMKITLPRYLLSVVDLLNYINNLQMEGNKQKAVYMISATVCWSLWKARNDKIFNNKACQLSKMMGEVKALSFLWLSSRAAKLKLEWMNWREFRFIW
ncbi:uncharacterized protein LOC118481817 [Helianthus annuus]|uniref:uncharacterized protein LOC118481817 n=1 Tax=Helianthus annuus TaxID=4232 RepID=UPI001652F6BA|nr:uncharacterized protein LOC118481817 [Helianthus annuus]